LRETQIIAQISLGIVDLNLISIDLTFLISWLPFLILLEVITNYYIFYQTKNLIKNKKHNLLLIEKFKKFYKLVKYQLII
jgi:hypothetical protein